MVYKYPDNEISSRTEVKKLAQIYDELDLSGLSFVSRAAAHELQNNDNISFFGTDKVDERMETRYSGK